jgi:hypothetical protein
VQPGMDEIDLLAAVQTLLEVKRTCRDRGRRIDLTRLTQSGHRPGRNPAVQRAPAQDSDAAHRCPYRLANPPATSIGRAMLSGLSSFRIPDGPVRSWVPETGSGHEAA